MMSYLSLDPNIRLPGINYENQFHVASSSPSPPGLSAAQLLLPQYPDNFSGPAAANAHF